MRRGQSTRAISLPGKQNGSNVGGTHGFKGGYVQFTLTNSTSLYLDLHSSCPPDLSNENAHQVQRADAPDDRCGSATPSKISLAVQVEEHDPVLLNDTEDKALRVAVGLQRTRDYTVRATLLNAPIGSPMATLDFGGIWMSKGGHLLRNQLNKGSPSGALLGQERNIEVVSALQFSRATDALSAYPVLLANAFNMSHSLVAIVEHCLTDVCPQGRPSIQNLYFRTSPSKARPLRMIPQHTNTVPTALILSLGLTDLDHFLASKRSSQEVSTYMDGFVHSYAEFITAIRSASQSYIMAAGQSIGGIDASYEYNSAPKTLPIFLLTPFTPNRRLRRLLGHGVSGVARSLQANGDKATTWVDTDGWLSVQDFPSTNNGNQSIEDLNELGHAKVAAMLSSHVCPYLRAECGLFKHDTFSGDLYVPSEAGLGKLMEDRKVTLIKDILGMS